MIGGKKNINSGLGFWVEAISNTWPPTVKSPNILTTCFQKNSAKLSYNSWEIIIFNRDKEIKNLNTRLEKRIGNYRKMAS